LKSESPDFSTLKLLQSRNYIIKEDLEHFLPAKKAAKAFEMLDVDSDGKVRFLLGC